MKKRLLSTVILSLLAIPLLGQSQTYGADSVGVDGVAFQCDAPRAEYKTAENRSFVMLIKTEKNGLKFEMVSNDYGARSWGVSDDTASTNGYIYFRKDREPGALRMAYEVPLKMITGELNSGDILDHEDKYDRRGLSSTPCKRIDVEKYNRIANAQQF
jgi:hypothetical protein